MVSERFNELFLLGMGSTYFFIAGVVTVVILASCFILPLLGVWEVDDEIGSDDIALVILVSLISGTLWYFALISFLIYTFFHWVKVFINSVIAKRNNYEYKREKFKIF